MLFVRKHFTHYSIKYTAGTKRVLAILMSVGMAVFSVFGTDVYSYSDTISDLQRQEKETQDAITSLEKESANTRAAINSLQEQQAAAQNNVNSLSVQSKNLSSTFNSYSNQLDTLGAQIEDAEQKLAATSGEIVSLNKELRENREAEKALYEKLKLQIKFSYEKGLNKSLIMTLLGSRSLGDFLNRAEYVSSIVSYQQKLLKDYKEVGKKIEEETAVLEVKEEELNGYQDELDKQQNALESLQENVRNELYATNADLNNEKSKVADYANQLKILDEKQKALESQVAAAQARLAQQIAARLAAQEAAGKKEDTSGSYAASASELEWLAATIMAEAGNQSYTGKLGVGTVIMNRVFSSQFPNTIQGVITQNMQFASYRSGKVEYYIEHGASSSCVQAAQEVLNGARIGDYLFFMTQKWADYYGIAEYTMIGAHAFFYKWVTKPKEEPAPVEENSGDSGANNEENNSSDNTESSENNESSDNNENQDDGASSEENQDNGDNSNSDDNSGSE